MHFLVLMHDPLAGTLLLLAPSFIRSPSTS